MLLTDSMEEPPAGGRTSGSIHFFSNSYARLPEHFFARLAPTPVAKPNLIKFNDSLASELGLNTQGLDPDGLAAVFAGNVTPPGAEPIAMTYAGHQFGNFVPRLGDGRAILLGEVLDRNGERREVQLKGAGRTPFSRRGDGRAANSDHARAGGRLNRRTCLPRPPVTWSRADPRRVESHPRRNLPIFRRARRPGSRQLSCRLRN